MDSDHDSVREFVKSLKIGNWWEDIREICDLPEGSEGLLELTGIQLLVAIEVHSPEDHLEGSEANASLLLDSKLESKVQLTYHNVLVHTVEGHCESKYFLYLKIDTPSSLNSRYRDLNSQVRT